ncbi:N-acetylmuramidase domain-containing protein [Novosphingobium sp. UBA1939]|uniref:N-acetylmuramidase domain-containing protein n=1 Tax=Novosphingobium sp. UBA1939 TaxID=1946982 RepID=UPI0025D6B055|nr:N-acetylmuramidase domain-containing protein [Novosphingobium sp. UBA1939]
MNIAQLQQRLGTGADGIWGTRSKLALLDAFANTQANAISPSDMQAAAQRLGCSVLQLSAVRAVEAAGKGFDPAGRPKILFERHKFHRFTAGRFSPTWFSQSVAGGYSTDANNNGINDSWDKLSDAIATGAVDAAFMACSWGAFQIMGEWWDELGYPNPFAMAWTCAQSEGDHLEMLVRYIEHFQLQDELRALSSNPASCRAFAAAYNGPAYRKNRYDEKLAQRMAA